MAHGSDNNGKGPQRRASWQTLARFFSLMEGFGPRVALVAGASVLTSVAVLLNPWLRKLAIDDGMLAGNRDYLIRIFWILVGLHVMQIGAGYVQALVVTWLGQATLNRLRKRLFARLEGLSLDYHERRQPGKLISRMINDLEAISQLITGGTTTIIQAPMVLVGTSVILFTLFDWRLALAIHMLFPILGVVVISFRKLLFEAFHRTRETVAALTEQLHQTAAGIRVIKSMGHERLSQQHFRELNEEDYRANVRAGAIFAYFFPIIELVMATGFCIVMWYGGSRSIAGTTTAGDLMAIIGYLFRIFEPIQQLAELFNSVQRGLVAVERVQDLLIAEPTIQDKPNAKPLGPIHESIRFEDVGFAYDGENYILRDVNLDIRFGETVAFVGPTGAGKSSLMKLLSRMYDPQQGRILIDGHDIRDVQVQSIRSQMGIVLQETFLFVGSIRDNIRYGRPDASDEEVRVAARLANAEEFILSLPDGYDTDVHERGVKLSSGQRQLVAFARALLVNPRILILDEATSSVDPFTEKRIQEATEALLKDRISLVIAHRLTTIVKADKICIVVDGRIVAQGSHAELMGSSELYASLHQRNFLPGETEAPKEPSDVLPADD